MTQNNKTKRTSSPLIKKLMAEASPLEKMKNKSRVELACRIDDLIKERKHTYTEFSKLVGKHPSEITKWVSGTHNFTMDTLVEIASALNIELTSLFNESKSKVVYRTKVEIIAIAVEKSPYANNHYLNEDMPINCGLSFNGSPKINYA